MTDEFQIGQVLEWRNRANPDAVLEKRQVVFKGWRNHQALVSFGLTSDGRGDDVIFSVPRDEVSRPAPPQPFHTPERPLPPPPIPLSIRRETLAQRHASWVEACDAVSSADQLVTRGQERLQKAQHALREYADLEKRAANAVLHEIKIGPGNGHSVYDDDAEWLLRERALRDVRAAESALHQLSQELVDARTLAKEREHALENSAAAVVAGVIERETLKLAVLEAQAVQVRAVLRAAAMLWVSGAAVPVNPEASTILQTWPYHVDDPVGERVQLAEQRQAPFADLFTRLVSGEIDAEF